MPCYVKHSSNCFKTEGSRKHKSPFWRGIYQCSNVGCCKYEIEVDDFDENSQSMVTFDCLVIGKINHVEVLNNEILKRLNAQEKLKIVLKHLANSNNSETVVNMELDELKNLAPDSNSNKLKIDSFENLKNLNLKNKLKDRYRKILENLFGN